ncbi:hypothetical protein GCM10007424_20510 [Flavobacterium suaedae]|uniref:Tox-PL domain-containing protein n=1 Tax=Flavobacterium suaedae TaxID=1767027 RepID=A0ABQ1JZM6_9FLAO|nr:hypothetical protein [Flavobacterium suaedae]GGB80295.1 hypothetical protein GCM10007424_20510 [Flavobacterium suaedae]
MTKNIDMGTFSDLIKYLRLDRQAKENITSSINEVFLTYLEDGNESYTVDKNSFETDMSTYVRIFQILDTYNATIIYLWNTSAGRKYFIKTSNNTFYNLLTNETEFPNLNELQEYPINLQYSEYIYDTLLNRVVIYPITLKEAVVFSDTIPFNDSEKYIKEIESGDYKYWFSKPVTLFANIMNVLLYGEQMLYDTDRDVEVIKSHKDGIIDIIPLLDIDIYSKTYILKYSFHTKDFQPSFGTEDNSYALILKFNHIGGILSFLNETLFEHGLDLTSVGGNATRITFQDNFRNQVLRPLERKIKADSKLYYIDALEILYYLPDFIHIEIDTEVLWLLVESGIKRNSLTNKLTIAEEDIFIKILEIILERENLFVLEEKEKEEKGEEDERKANGFIERLAKKVDTDTEMLIVEYLYDRIHGNNGHKFVRMVNKAWRQSRFVNFDPEVNTEFKTSDGPIFLAYQSQKSLGFYSSNVAAYFATNTKGERERIVQVAYDTGQYETITTRDGDGGSEEKLKEIKDYFWYHPFHPIYLKNIEKQETEMELDTIVPAFVLLANRDKQFWSNVMTAGEYALDAVAIASGVGTLAEISAGVIRSFAILRAIGATIELSSGVANALLKLTGAEDSEIGQAISEYLFWLEMLSLAGEVTAAIRKGLKKAAQKVIGTEEDLIKLQKQLDDIAIEEDGVTRKLTDDEKDDVLKNLRESAGMAENIRVSKDPEKVREFLEGLERLSKITPEEALDNIEEALIYFNHKVIDGEIVQISDTNCVNVVQAVVEFLKTGKIKIVKHSSYQNIGVLESLFEGIFFRKTIPQLGQSMKEGEIGIIYGARTLKPGHVFNVIKTDNKLLLVDGQNGKIANLKNGYEYFKYLKIN